MNINEHFREIEDKVKVAYSIASEARARGLDPLSKVEVPLATTLAGKVVGLISSVYPQVNNPQLISRITELEKEYGSLDPAICLKIAEEVAKERFCKFQSLLEAIDAGIRVAFAYITLGVVASPIEGFTHFKLKKTKKGEDYFSAYFSGPIRSAGGTAAAFSLVIIDYLREIFGYAKYDPTEQEVKRAITEVFDYHERITNLQYLPTEEEVEFLARSLPIQVNGDPSEKREVSNYKDLERVETNLIRGGFCLVLAEGIAQKAQKILKIIKKLREKGFKLAEWDFLEDFTKLHEKREKGKTKESPTYIQDLVAGRPVLGHPSKSGAFRLVYGRARNSGYSTLAIHPASMQILGGFIATGTQIKIELPTKGAAISVCDSIDGPIVKLDNESVLKIKDAEQAKKLYSHVEEIIYLGDILVPYGDFANRNHILMPAGYVEKYWLVELKAAAEKQNKKDLASSINEYEIDFEKAKKISQELNIPLHPNFVYYWSQISYEDFLAFLDWLGHAYTDKKIVFPFNRTEQERFRKGKRAMELIGMPHQVVLDNVVLDEETTRALFANLGISGSLIEKEKYPIYNEILEICKEIKQQENVLDVINQLSDFSIKDKAGTFIGSRMGRPEKAKLRKLIGSPHVLFPVGEEGGRLRSVQEAREKGSVKADFPIYYCEKCQKETIYFICEKCNSQTKKQHYCVHCQQKFFSQKCPQHMYGQEFSARKLDIANFFNAAIKNLALEKEEIPVLIKGVKGTSSRNHIPENLAKGFLRALFNLHVNKDGTVRYDATELPLTHFKPSEIGLDAETAKKLGYTEDMNSQELKNENQILELKPHDIILPACPESPDEKADDVFMNIANFIDALLLRFYKSKPFYNLKKREDLIGQIVVCIAPHNCAGVVGRIIGFSKVQALLASPYMHAAMRRDCFDYDTYFPIKQGSNWRIIKLGEIVENLKPDKIVDSFGTTEKAVKDYKTLGFNKHLGEVRVNNFTKHPKISMFEIKTSLGKKIKVTENHKFLVNRQIKRASDLKIGDRLPLPIKIGINSRNLRRFNLLELLKEENIMVRGITRTINQLNKTQREKTLKKLKLTTKQFINYNLRDSYPAKFILSLNKRLQKKIFKEGRIAAKRDSISIPITIQTDKELLEVIGLYAAEGYSRAISGKKGLNQVYIASSGKELRDLVKSVIKKHFGLVPSEKKQDRVTFSSKILYLFFTKILEAGSNARNKRVPYLFLNLPLEKLACFLRGYFEGDGSAEKKRRKISCDSVSEGLLNDLEFCLARFGIFVKRYEYEKEPGPKVRQFYLKKNRRIPKFKITKLTIGSDFVDKFMNIGFLSKRKNKILAGYKKMGFTGMRIESDKDFVYDPIVSITPLGEKESYCLNVNTKNHLVIGNSIVSAQCDGDEASISLLLDVLLNFSREYLPFHRGSTQDAPLVLNARIHAGEVDDMVFDVDVVKELPLELYQAAEKFQHPSSIKIEQIRDRLRKNEFSQLDYSYETSSINAGVLCSSYKTLATMQEKVQKQMELVEKIRAVNTSDVARLIIERHFIRDIRGNLRKFSMQQFRCVKCNEKYRRPPLQGKCLKCGGRIIFTISEGSIIKYLQPALDLAEKYNLPEYLKQNLELTKSYIESIFGKETEKQEALKKWF